MAKKSKSKNDRVSFSKKGRLSKRFNEFGQWFLILATIGVGWWQISALNNRLENDAMTTIYSHSLQLSLIAIDNPEIHMMYLDTYGGEPDEIDETRLDLYCESQLDFFELLVLEIEALDQNDRSLWTKYIRDQFQTSEALRSFYVSNLRFYSPQLQKLLGEVKDVGLRVDAKNAIE